MIRRYALTGFTALVALIVLMPLVWMVSVSFMAPGEAAAFFILFLCILAVTFVQLKLAKKAGAI